MMSSTARVNSGRRKRYERRERMLSENAGRALDWEEEDMVVVVE